MSKILVVGGSGFIGSHVADKLTSENHDVIIYDIKDSPYISKNQEMVTGGILDLDKIKSIINNGIDYVYNFASIADIKEANKNNDSVIDVNIKGHLKLMEACFENHVKRYIYSSSLYVYSQYGSMYKASKQSAELYIEAFNEINELDFTIVRCGTVYGPRAQDWNGFYKLIKKIIQDKQLVYEGSEDEVRSFIHVEDVAELFVQVLDDKYKNEFVIINGPEKYSGKEFLKLLGEIFEGDLEKSLMKFTEERRPGHYVVTPYKYFPRKAKQITKDSFIELGQGILDLANHIQDTEN